MQCYYTYSNIPDLQYFNVLIPISIFRQENYRSHISLIDEVRY